MTATYQIDRECDFN